MNSKSRHPYKQKFNSVCSIEKIQQKRRVETGIYHKPTNAKGHSSFANHAVEGLRNMYEIMTIICRDHGKI